MTSLCGSHQAAPDIEKQEATFFQELQRDSPFRDLRCGHHVPREYFKVFMLPKVILFCKVIFRDPLKICFKTSIK